MTRSSSRLPSPADGSPRLKIGASALRATTIVGLCACALPAAGVAMTVRAHATPCAQPAAAQPTPAQPLKPVVGAASAKSAPNLPATGYDLRLTNIREEMDQVTTGLDDKGQPKAYTRIRVGIVNDGNTTVAKGAAQVTCSRSGSSVKWVGNNDKALTHNYSLLVDALQSGQIRTIAGQSYQVTCSVSFVAGTTDQTPTNNNTSQTVTASTAPDLMWDTWNWPKLTTCSTGTPAVAGQDACFQKAVNNLSGAWIKQAWTAKCAYGSKTWTGTGENPTSPNNTGVKVTGLPGNVGPLPAGPAKFVCWADDTYAIAESDESNNTLNHTFTVHSSVADLKYDIQVARIYESLNAMAKKTSIWIFNYGEQVIDTPDATCTMEGVNFTLDPSFCYYIKPQEARQCTVQTTSDIWKTVKNGKHKMTCTASIKYPKVTETSTANNDTTMTINVTGGPE